jgi:hypothetical protein
MSAMASFGSCRPTGCAGPAAAKTTWLCKPGLKPDPGAPVLTTTVYNAPLTAALRAAHPKAERRPPIDCFYVYPTVSDEKTPNSDLKIQSTEHRPAGSVGFGRPNALLSPKKPAEGDEVLFTNPSDLGGGSGVLNVIGPSAPFAPGPTIWALGAQLQGAKPIDTFWAAPGAYTSTARTPTAPMLEITARNGAQTPSPGPTPQWGLHLLDANPSLGNLISIVKAESKAYLARTAQ